jgi:hypothetical protein
MLSRISYLAPTHCSARQLVLAPERIKSDLDVLPELEELWAGHLEKIFSNPTAAV